MAPCPRGRQDAGQVGRIVNVPEATALRVQSLQLVVAHVADAYVREDVYKPFLAPVQGLLDGGEAGAPVEGVQGLLLAFPRVASPRQRPVQEAPQVADQRPAQERHVTAQGQGDRLGADQQSAVEAGQRAAGTHVLRMAQRRL